MKKKHESSDEEEEYESEEVEEEDDDEVIDFGGEFDVDDLNNETINFDGIELDINSSQIGKANQEKKEEDMKPNIGTKALEGGNVDDKIDIRGSAEEIAKVDVVVEEKEEILEAKESKNNFEVESIRENFIQGTVEDNGDDDNISKISKITIKTENKSLKSEKPKEIVKEVITKAIPAKAEFIPNKYKFTVSKNISKDRFDTSKNTQAILSIYKKPQFENPSFKITERDAKRKFKLVFFKNVSIELKPSFKVESNRIEVVPQHKKSVKFDLQDHLKTLERVDSIKSNQSERIDSQRSILKQSSDNLEEENVPENDISQEKEEDLDVEKEDEEDNEENIDAKEESLENIEEEENPEDFDEEKEFEDGEEEKELEELEEEIEGEEENEEGLENSQEVVEENEGDVDHQSRLSSETDKEEMLDDVGDEDNAVINKQDRKLSKIDRVGTAEDIFSEYNVELKGNNEFINLSHFDEASKAGFPLNYNPETPAANVNKKNSQFINIKEDVNLDEDEEIQLDKKGLFDRQFSQESLDQVQPVKINDLFNLTDEEVVK
jgi:hypothetical protein